MKGIKKKWRWMLTVFAVLLIFVSLLYSPTFRHILKKMVVKAEIKFATINGQKPTLVSITGTLRDNSHHQDVLRGARLEVLDSKSGWAAITDNSGNFFLPDVTWYPNAKYTLLVTNDSNLTRQLTLVAPKSQPANGRFNVEELYFEQGCETDFTHTPGVSSIHSINCDVKNSDYYRDLYQTLTRDAVSEEEKFAAINRYVNEKLTCDETTPSQQSPRQTLEKGSRFCGHLVTAMANIVEAGDYQTRMLNMIDQQTLSSTHMVLEIYYNDGWHLYDPSFGLVFETPNGRVASYEELRLTPDLLKQVNFHILKCAALHNFSGNMLEIYQSGIHHIYYFNKTPAE